MSTVFQITAEDKVRHVRWRACERLHQGRARKKIGTGWISAEPVAEPMLRRTEGGRNVASSDLASIDSLRSGPVALSSDHAVKRSLLR